MTGGLVGKLRDTLKDMIHKRLRETKERLDATAVQGPPWADDEAVRAFLAGDDSAAERLPAGLRTCTKNGHRSIFAEGSACDACETATLEAELADPEMRARIEGVKPKTHAERLEEALPQVAFRAYLRAHPKDYERLVSTENMTPEDATEIVRELHVRAMTWIDQQMQGRNHPGDPRAVGEVGPHWPAGR